MKKFLLAAVVSFMLCSYANAFWDENTFVWAKDAVNKWQDKGIISGYEDGSFRGKNHITRAELLSIVNKLNGTKENALKRPANDVAEGLWYTDSVAMAINHEIVQLDENGNIRPYEYATREETMVILANLFHLEYEKDAYTYLTTNFYDANQIHAENLTKVAGVVDFGFAKGYPDGTLRPLAYVTRAELIAMLNNCIEDIYGEGIYVNQIIANSIIVNDGAVSLKNFEVKDKIFVMDGAFENPPYIVNTNVGKGINSRVGDIEIKRDAYWDTLIEKGEPETEKKYEEPLIATVKYSETSWTNENVVVTVKLEGTDYEIINNGGKNKYTFETNGEFIFLCRNRKGKVVKFLTEVDYIDKISPRLVASVAKTENSAVVTVAVSQDDLSPIKKMGYTEGKTSASSALNDIEIINNTFTVSENGIYTIGVKDEAGNAERIYINITGLVENIVETPSTGGEGNTTPPTGEGAGSTTPPTGEGAGSTTPPTDEGAGSTTPPTDEGEGSTTPPTDEGEGSTTPPTGEGAGSTTPPTDEGAGSTTPPTDEGAGSTTPPTDEGEGSTTPPTDEGEGSTTSPTGEVDTSSEPSEIMP